MSRNGSGGSTERADSPDGRIDQRELLRVLTAFSGGDLSARMPANQAGVPGEIADTLNGVLQLAGLQQKAEQLALTSKHRSEFLANMSHELRTPLNSLLILAQMLAENGDARLTPKQVMFAQTIYHSGTELLALINDILDLSKIESGLMAVDLDQIHLADILDRSIRTFRHMAEEKGISFETAIDAGVAQTIYTDPKRLQQILKNLLSNALKFTERGQVTLDIKLAAAGWNPAHAILSQAETVVAFSVKDTGIGIPEDQQAIIFEPFRQADGSGRKYGGTGLGLSISRELTRLLQGELVVASQRGEGSTFTLYLPAAYMAVPAAAASLLPMAFQPVEVHDDRDGIQPGDKVLLIVEDDPAFAAILRGLARDTGIKVVIALGGARGLSVARELKPHAILLNLRLPQMAGAGLLDQLKNDPATRAIPMHVMSVEGDQRHGPSPALMDVFGKIRKSIERNEIRLLAVESGDGQWLAGVLSASGVQTTLVKTAGEALNGIREKAFDCVVIDLKHAPGFIANLQRQPGGSRVPVIVYTGGDPAPEEQEHLKQAAQGTLVRAVASADLLLEETALFLHRVESSLSGALPESTPTGGKVLIVDDDVRSIFALTSVLERHKLDVVYAESGSRALEILRSAADIDAVLTDMLMPGMDGYQTVRAIRETTSYRNLPIIAITARAMPGDREKCIAAGASAYLAKPVNPNDLICLLRAWLPRIAPESASKGYSSLMPREREN